MLIFNDAFLWSDGWVLLMTVSGRNMPQYSAVINPRKLLLRLQNVLGCVWTLMKSAVLVELLSSALSPSEWFLLLLSVIIENSSFRSSLVPFTCFSFTRTELVRRDFEGSKALCSGWKLMGIVCLISICALGKSPSNWLNICTIGCRHGGTMWLSNHLFPGTKTHWQQTLIGRSSPRLVYFSRGCRGQSHEGKQRHRISRK